jgi:hypothetical protein
LEVGVAEALNLGQYLLQATAEREDRWTEEEIVLLGTMPDEEVAAQISRTAQAVGVKRREMGIPSYRPPGCPAYLWTEEELALLGTAADEEIARQTGRTTWAVCRKRRQRGIPKPCDRRRREHRR